jgi:WD40 repeat protein
MSAEPVIDKIVGSSAATRGTLSVHYETGACAFSCDGFFSIVLYKEKRRYDLQVSPDSREITALAFSSNGRHFVVGELGPNARFYILTFSETFDRIQTKIEVKTKENGFSCLSMSSDKGRLVTVGVDAQPFFLLWDTLQAKPVCIGCYHFPTCPTSVSLSSDGTFALASGDKMLKFIDCDIPSGPAPVVLRTRKGNIGQFKTAFFVGTAITPDQPYSAYALTKEGILCLFDSNSIPYGQKRKQSSIVVVPIRLNCGETTSLALDKRIILIGTTSGTILAIKKEKDQPKVFGQFASGGKRVVAIGIAEKISAATYDDGHLLFWERRINCPPRLALPGHRGPVCSLFVLSDCILSCGSDSTVRLWKLQRNQELIGKSSQEQVCCKVFGRRASDFLTNLTGVRCIAAREGVVFAGDNAGQLHVLSVEALEESKGVFDNSAGVMCLSVHPTESYLGAGGGDGAVRVYSIKGNALSLLLSKPLYSSPVTAVGFSQDRFICTSGSGIRFCKLLSGDVYASHDSEEPMLSLSVIPNKKIVIVGGCDRALTFYRVSDGSVFRRHKLSASAYPVAIAVDKSGLFIAVALSDGLLRLVDLFSGDTIYSFGSHTGLVTSIHFHEGDLILSSFSGCIMRWALPSVIHDAIGERESGSKPLLSMLLAPPKVETAADPSMRVSGSLMTGSKPAADWIFKEIHNEALRSEKAQAQDGTEEEDEVSQADFDAPRPMVAGEYETKVDDIVRTSFVRKKKEQEEQRALKQPSVVEELSIPARGRRAAPAPKPKPATKPKAKESDDTDPFTVQSSDHSIGPVESRADEMKNAAQHLVTAYENAKRLLAVPATSPEEIASQKVLRATVDRLTQEVKGNVAKTKAQLTQLAQTLLATVEQLDA